MEIFNRFWELNIKSNPATQPDFEYVIKQDAFGNSLRVNFDINVARDIRYYNGTIKIYNLEEDKRRNLVYNILGNKFGTGPQVKFVVGYQGSSGLIMDGIVTRGYTTREPSSGDWITVLQCGASFKSDKIVTLQSVKIADPDRNGKSGGLISMISSWIDILVPLGSVDTVDKDDRFFIKRARNFDSNLKNAVNIFLGKENVNKAVGFSGPVAKILNEIGEAFGLIFYYDNEGFNVTTTILSNEQAEIEINKDTGMIGSPIYTDTGTKTKTYLRADYRLFQPVHVKSGVLDKVVKITTLNHRGDTHTNEWYSEIDANNLGSLLVRT